MSLLTEIKIPSFLLFQIFSGVVLGFIIWRSRKKLQLSDTVIFDLILLYIIGSVVLGRLFFIFDNAADFGDTSWSIYPFYYKPGAERVWFRQMPWVLIRFWEGDISYSGMLWGGIFSTLVLSWKRKFLVKGAGIIVRALCIAQVVQVLGLFIIGSYFGKQTDLFVGIKYPTADDVFRYPVQLFEVVVLTGIVTLQRYLKKLTKGAGVIGMYLFLFAWAEIFLSFLVEREESSDLQIIHIGYLLFAILGIVLFVFEYRGRKGVVGEDTRGVQQSQKGYTGIQYSSYRNYQASFTTFQKIPTSIFGRIKRRLTGIRKKDDKN